MRVSLENIALILVSLLFVLWSAFYIFGLVTWPVIPDAIALLNVQSLGIVLGGVFTAALISYPARMVLEALSKIFSVFSQSVITDERMRKDISMIIEWLRLFRSNRSEAYSVLQKRHLRDFEAYLISLMNTNYSPEEIKSLAEKQISTTYEKRLQVSRVLQSMGNTSPAFGMLGTLFGLIIILDSFEDATQLGRGLSLALMTTLYGLVFAHFVFFPLALKVRTTADKQMFRESMLLEGVILIRQEKPPMVIKDQLLTYMDRKYIHAS